jgi:hypothetical protein
VGARSLRRIAQASAAAPPGARVWGLECRLDADTERVDVCAIVPEGSRGELRAWADDRGAASPSWDGFRAFCRAWVDGSLPALQAVPRVFLELDLDGDEPPAGPPGIFVNLEEIAWRAGGELEPQLAAAQEVLEMLRGRPLGRGEVELLTRCYARLPARGMLLHVGTLLSRPGRPMRACAWLGREGALSYLAEQGVNLEGARRTLAMGVLTRAREHVDCQIDLDPSVGVAAHLELSFPERASSRERWGELLGFLVDEGLASPAKRDALLRWPGSSAGSSGEDAAPHLVSRALSHLKLSLPVDGPARVKGYLTWAVATNGLGQLIASAPARTP